MLKIKTFAICHSLLAIVACSQQPSQKVDIPKNIILMIGDGMGPGQISLLQQFVAHSKIAKDAEFKFSFAEFNDETMGLSITDPHGKLVVDSACSATQIAIGQQSRSEMIGLDINGNATATILEKAAKKGLSTGLVSDTRLTHATPASFASHVANRWFEDQIAEGMIETAPDVLLSGGANRFYPKGYEAKVAESLEIKSRRGDKKNLIERAKEKEFEIIHTKKELEKFDSDKKLLGLFTNHNYPDALWFHNNKNNPKRKIPSLLEMSKAAIKKLSQNEKGFFVMIEGGQIDWAAHRNDAGTMLHEMLSFNETLLWIMDWVKNNPDTLLVVTADHETGAFGLGYNVHTLPEEKRLSGDKFKNMAFRPYYNYGNFQVLDQLYNQKMSYADLLKQFDSLPKKERTDSKLGKMILEVTGIKLTDLEISEIRKEIKNPYKTAWHRSLADDMVPHMHGKQSFYPTPNDTRTSLIGRATSSRQNVVWGTGGHTSTPVSVFALGPKSESFKGFQSHPSLGAELQRALDL